VIQDGNVTLGETGAIVEYILNRLAKGQLAIPVDADNYPQYLYFLHFANGYFQPGLNRYRVVQQANLPEDNISVFLAKRGFEQSLQILEDRVSKNKWLAGEEFTAADIVNVFSLTTMRLFIPYSLEGYGGILAYLRRVSEREGYQRAMDKGDPGFKPLLGAEKPEPLKPKK
jgi:glutathione S-transferase